MSRDPDDHGRRRGAPVSLLPVLLACALVAVACYQYRAHAPTYPGVAEGEETLWSFAWGLAGKEPCIVCEGQALAEVTVRDNLGFTLLTIVSLGIVNPKKVEWRCARAQPSEGHFAPEDTPAAADTTPAPADTAADSLITPQSCKER